MDSSLHMHVASLRVQDEVRRGSRARLAAQARQASRAAATGERRGHRIVLHRAIPRSFRRAF